MTDALARIDDAQRALSEVETPAEARELIARLDVLRKIAQELDASREEQNHIVGLRLHAMRRGGELLRPDEEHRGGSKTRVGFLKEIDLDDHQSARWQLLARLGDERLERYIDDVNRVGDDLTISSALKFAKHALTSPHPLVDASPDDDWEPVTRFLIDVDTADVVASIMRVCFPDAHDALDVTYGSGNFWNEERTVEVTAHDLDPARALHGEMDFRDLKYGDQSFDVVLFDPPHLADTGEDSVLGERFGSYSNDELARVVAQGALEAWRVSKLGMVVKVADTTHNGYFVSMSDWVRDALDGLVPFETVYQVRTRPFIDPKWLKPQLSAINNGSIYMIFRHGSQRRTR